MRTGVGKDRSDLLINQTLVNTKSLLALVRDASFMLQAWQKVQKLLLRH
ncbi:MULTISPECIES: hypothetical protein [Streptococcus]|nr:hypothetical protein [Streptococcus acidominimus]